MDIEGRNRNCHPIKKESWRTVMTLAYQSLGVVYGDLSTSPLYVYKSAFAKDIQHLESNEEIFGVLSFVFWTLTLIPPLKYVFIVLRADDNGEGGTFALYTLLCRHARISTLPNGQLADMYIHCFYSVYTLIFTSCYSSFFNFVINWCFSLEFVPLMGAAYNPHTVEQVFRDFKGRRDGMIKAHTTASLDSFEYKKED